MYGKIIQEKESDLGCESTGFVLVSLFLHRRELGWESCFWPCPIFQGYICLFRCIRCGVQVSIFYWCWVSSWKEKEPLGCGSVSWWESLSWERWRKEMRSWKEKEPLEWFGTEYELNCHYILKQSPWYSRQEKSHNTTSIIATTKKLK